MSIIKTEFLATGRVQDCKHYHVACRARPETMSTHVQCWHTGTSRYDSIKRSIVNQADAETSIIK